MKLTQNQTLGVIIILAIGFGSGGIWYQQSSAELTDSEVISIIESYFRSDEGQRLIEREILADNMDLDDIQNAIQLLDTQHEIKFSSVETGFITMRENIQSLELEIALLKAGITSTGSSSGNSDFDLEICQDLNCVDDSGLFNQGDSLYLKGNHNTSDKTLEFEIRDSDNVRIASGQSSMTQGNFIWAWSIPDNLPDDIYTISIEINNNKDRINFTVD
jgi:hypothetical protein